MNHPIDTLSTLPFMTHRQKPLHHAKKPSLLQPPCSSSPFADKFIWAACGPQIEIAVVRRSTIIYHSWLLGHNASFSGNPTRTRRSLVHRSQFPNIELGTGVGELCAHSTIADISLCGVHHVTLPMVVVWLYGSSTYCSSDALIDGQDIVLALKVRSGENYWEQCRR